MENIVTKEHMEALQALSGVNIKISEAFNKLRDLEQKETEYLVEREKKAVDRIQKTIELSKGLLHEADKNYGQIKEIENVLTKSVNDIEKLSTDYAQLLEDFAIRNNQWEKQITEQQNDIAAKTRDLQIIRIELENDRKNIELAQKRLEEGQTKLASDRGTLERTINRLKQGKL